MIDFDQGSYIVENAHMFTYPVQYQQLCYDDDKQSKFSYYPKESLLEFVASTSQNVFGTAFVAYSAYDFVNFLKQYTKDHIYHIGIFDEFCTGYNSLLLSPMGEDWAKNFDKIVFLSPCLDESFVARLNEVCSAEIYLPMDKELDKQRFSNLDLSRETFGKVFKALTSRNFAKVYSICDVFNQKLKGKMNFDTFYVAYLVFKELGLLKVSNDICLNFYQTGEKKSLNDSKLYNKLLLLKNSFNRG